MITGEEVHHLEGEAETTTWGTEWVPAARLWADLSEAERNFYGLLADRINDSFRSIISGLEDRIRELEWQIVDLHNAS